MKTVTVDEATCSSEEKKKTEQTHGGHLGLKGKPAKQIKVVRDAQEPWRVK